jgi:ElaB/YqjD/DUF883 family membrane-anchored ribosome-binding protein
VAKVCTKIASHRDKLRHAELFPRNADSFWLNETNVSPRNRESLRNHSLPAMSDESNPAFGSPADPFSTAKASAIKAAEDLRHAAAAKAQEFRQAAENRAQQLKQSAENATDQVREYADRAWSETRAHTQDIAAEAEKFAREKPLQALLAAFGVGFLVGLILKR